MARLLQLDAQDKQALHALDTSFTFNNNYEIATVIGEMEINMIRPADDGGARFWLTITLPGGEELDVRIARTQRWISSISSGRPNDNGPVGAKPRPCTRGAGR